MQRIGRDEDEAQRASKVSNALGTPHTGPRWKACTQGHPWFPLTPSVRL